MHGIAIVGCCLPAIVVSVVVRRLSVVDCWPSVVGCLVLFASCHFTVCRLSLSVVVCCRILSGGCRLSFVVCYVSICVWLFGCSYLLYEVVCCRWLVVDRWSSVFGGQLWVGVCCLLAIMFRCCVSVVGDRLLVLYYFVYAHVLLSDVCSRLLGCSCLIVCCGWLLSGVGCRPWFLFFC